MKKTIVFALIIMMALALSACTTQPMGNRAYGSDVQTFTYAYIRLGDKDIVQGYITQWRDYHDSDAVQIMIDGKYYLTHYSCVVMVADPTHGNLGYDFVGESN